jgi:hypothetical protein
MDLEISQESVIELSVHPYNPAKEFIAKLARRDAKPPTSANI